MDGVNIMTSKEWNDTLTTVLHEIASTTDINMDMLSPNSCLINKFENGLQHSPMHQDIHMETKDPDTVLLIALGAPRPFQFTTLARPITTHTLILQPGMILLFTPDCNFHFKHGRPVAEKVKQPSYSVTYRKTIQRSFKYE